MLFVFVVLVITAAAITFLRDPYNYRLPRLPHEDGRDIFGFYYNHREPASILRFYSGYIALGPNLVGYLAILLPITWVPFALALFPLLVSSQRQRPETLRRIELATLVYCIVILTYL